MAPALLNWIWSHLDLIGAGTATCLVGLGLWRARARPEMWFIRRLVIVALAVACVGALPVTLILRLDTTQDGLIRALIAALVVAAGWFVTFIVQELRRLREREDLRQDVLAALYEEVLAVIEKLDEQPILEDALAMRRQIREGGTEAPFTPFVFSESPATIYDSVAADLALLRRPTLRVAVRFYAAYSDLASMAADISSERYVDLSPVRRWAGYRRLARKRMATLYWALRAERALSSDLGLFGVRLERSGANPLVTAEEILADLPADLS